MTKNNFPREEIIMIPRQGTKEYLLNKTDEKWRKKIENNPFAEPEQEYQYLLLCYLSFLAEKIATAEEWRSFRNKYCMSPDLVSHCYEVLQDKTLVEPIAEKWKRYNYLTSDAYWTGVREWCL